MKIINHHTHYLTKLFITSTISCIFKSFLVSVDLIDGSLTIRSIPARLDTLTTRAWSLSNGKRALQTFNVPVKLIRIVFVACSLKGAVSLVCLKKLEINLRETEQKSSFKYLICNCSIVYKNIYSLMVILQVRSKSVYAFLIINV